MVPFTFRGLVAPTFVPLNDDLTLNLDIIPKYAKFLADSGIKGIVVHGTTGEGTSLNCDERKQVTEAWADAVKATNQHLMVQVGGGPFPDVIELTKHAESIGADSILCLPELYFKPTTSADLIRFLRAVGEAAPNTPLLYYHIPAFTNVNISMGQFLNDVVGQIPTFQGIKYACFDLHDGVAALRANGGKFAVFLGADQLMAGAYTLGFDSAIATTLNIFPKLAVRILEASKQFNLKEAKEAQNILTDACAVVSRYGSFVPAMKMAMSLVTPINVGRAKAPLINVTLEQEKEMAVAMMAFNINSL